MLFIARTVHYTRFLNKFDEIFSESDNKEVFSGFKLDNSDSTMVMLMKHVTKNRYGQKFILIFKLSPLFLLLVPTLKPLSMRKKSITSFCCLVKKLSTQ